MTTRKEKPINDPLDVASIIITAITGGPSHVRLCIKGLYENWDFWEVTYPKCRFGKMEEVDYKEYDVEIGRHRNLPFPLPREIAEKAVGEMKRVEGRLYDVGELFFSQLFDTIGLDHTDHSDPERFVCSSGVEYILTCLGFPFCPLDFLVSPEDLIKSEFYTKVEEGGESIEST